MPKIELKNGKYVDDQMADGVPKGGTSGQVLKKNSNNDYDLIWGTASSGAGTVTSVAALTLGTTGTDLSSSVANGTTTPVITLNVPTASATNRGALSSTDWSTFNSKEPAISAGTTSEYWRGDKTWQTFPTIPTVGTWGALNYPTWTSGTPFVKMTAVGTFSLDTNTYLTSITSSDVTTALGYTPYNSTNPSGYISAAITSLNSLTGSTQTFSTGTSGTDFDINSSGTTHTFNLPTASSTNTGKLSNTDWTTFNNKVANNDTDYEYLMMTSFRTIYNY